jgi:nucleoside-diphosphate-sugar epimerase
MKALIIGGTGLISGAITRELLKKGHQVTVFTRGKRPLEQKGVKIVVGDRFKRAEFESAMKKLDVDAVFDLISFNTEDAASAYRAFQGRIKHFMHCSTVCAVGGPLTQIPATEDEPYQPLSGYGRGKKAAELYWLKQHREKGFPVTIFRPSHTYGPGGGWVLGIFMTDWDWDAELINRIRAGKPVIVHGDGQTLWQSCYVDDAAAGFVGAYGRKQTLGQIYNLCGHEVMTWDEYYRRVGMACGKAPKIVHLTVEQIAKGAPESATGFLREIALYHGAYAIDKAKRDIPAFRPQVTVQEGTRKHIAWLEKEGRLKKSPKRPFEDRLAKLAAKWDKEAAA